MPSLPLQQGELFAERYRIVQSIASGGMGAVYEAVHTVTGRRCALKVMLGHTVDREELRARFMQESRVAAQIGSEYIVDVLDAGVDEASGLPFLVMELLEGEDLGRRLVRLGRFSSEETVTYLWHAALALDRTHGKSIVHRDLKASNLFLTTRDDGRPLVKILDFGVAKIIPVEAASSEGATQTVGTPIYMAPEQFKAGGRVSAATDLYALGMLSYTMLVGAHYWKDEHDKCANPFAFASVAAHGPNESPTARAARRDVTLPPGFDAWFFRATSRIPSDRFPSATQAVLELSVALGVQMPTPYPSERMPLEPASGSGRKSLEGPSKRLPDTVESLSGRGSRSGASSKLPETVESLSLRSSGSGRALREPTGPSVPPPASQSSQGSHPSQGSQASHPSQVSVAGGAPVRAAAEASVTPAPPPLEALPNDEHTEHSLSVTSGDGLILARRSRQRLVWAVVGSALAVAVAGVSVAFLRGGKAPEPAIVNHASDSQRIEAPALPTPQPAASEKPPLEPTPPQAAHDEPAPAQKVFTPDQLEREAPAPAPQPRRTSRGATASRTPSPQTIRLDDAPAARPAPPRETPPKEPPPKSSDRTRLYGMD